MARTEPARRFSNDASPIEVLSFTAKALETGTDVCVATVVGIEGSCPSTPGQKLLIGKDGSAFGTVGGGAVEREVVDRMMQLLEVGATMPELRWYALAQDFGMTCGGRVHMLFEPLVCVPSVLIVGAGHIGAALAGLLARVAFRVVLTDQRPEAAAIERFSHLPGVAVRLGDPADVACDVPTSVPVVIATHDHALDLEAVTWALERGHVYVGGIGSRAKAARARKSLEERGVDRKMIERLRMPVGLRIGGRTPGEIALSVAAELVAWRAGKLGEFGGLQSERD